MKMKYLIIVSLILAILTIGAASATDDVAVDDELAVDGGVEIEEAPVDDVNEDIQSASNEDVLSDDYEGIDLYIDDEIAINEDYGGNSIAYVYNGPDYFNGIISLSVDGHNYFSKSFKLSDREDDVGISLDELNLPDSLKSGTHTILLSYLKNGVSTPKTLEKKVPFVYRTQVSEDKGSISVGETTYVRLDAAKGSTGTMNLYNYDDYNDKVGALIKSVAVVDGKAKIPIAGLAKGNHGFFVSYTVNGKSEDMIFDVYVYENTKGYTAGASSSITVGGDAVVTFSGVKKNGWLMIAVDGKDVKEILYTGGSLSEPISGLSVGEHQISVRYEKGDDFYSNTFTVAVKDKAPVTPQKATKITAKKATFKAKKKAKKYTITLKAAKTAVKGVKVTLKVGKKTYKAKTNAKGKATFKITKLTKKGKYTAVIKFAGNKNYKATSKKVKITVKK